MMAKAVVLVMATTIKIIQRNAKSIQTTQQQKHDKQHNNTYKYATTATEGGGETES